jgi:flavin reductase (DIM6/NTAB) family NADH-FMN oxidoreductase RutF
MRGRIAERRFECDVGGSFASADEVRIALRRWPSGVTVVTMGSGEAIHGLTVSSFASVSLAPPTILVCINGASRAHAMLAQRPYFAVNILSAGQRDVSAYFAYSGVGRRADGVAYHAATTVDSVVVSGAAAVLECSVAHVVPVGSHVTYFGTVHGVTATDLDPLLYYNGDYQDVVFGRRAVARGRLSVMSEPLAGNKLGDTPAIDILRIRKEK